MSIQQYWKERLLEGEPFFNKDFMKDPMCVRRATEDKDPWPKAVSRSKLYQDYLIWHQLTVVPTYQDVAYYQDNPDAIPQPAEEYVFYTTLAPWLYVIGKREQVSNYRVNVPEQFNNKVIILKKFAYFVRLCSLRMHIMAFELNSGTLVGVNPPDFTNVDRCKVIHDELKVLKPRFASSAHLDDNLLA